MASSPTWRKPSDVMKRRLVRRRTSSVPRKGPIKDEISSPQALFANKDSREESKKRKNPFSSSSQQTCKKICSDSSESLRSSLELPKYSSENRNGSIQNGDSSCMTQSQLLFTALDKTQASSTNDVPAAKLSAIENLQRNYNAAMKKTQDQDDAKQEKKSEEQQSKAPTFYPAYPKDWSLKTKLRFISRKPFSWCAPLKSHEESLGLTQCVKQEPSLSCSGDKILSGDSLEAKSEFARRCLVWSHPHIPWLKTYPRLVNDTRIGKPSAVFHSDEMQKALLNDWSRSLSSLFDLLRSGHCAHFYVCAHICTVLFRRRVTEENKEGNKGMQGTGAALEAIVTPTTRGFRQALCEEGVEFTMPLNKTQAKNPETENKAENDGGSGNKPCGTEGATTNNNLSETKANRNDRKTSDVTEHDDVTEGADITETDDGASSWLETLGIDKTKYRSLDPNKVKLQRDSFRMIDNRPESAVYVQGTNCNALLNFLLNCRSLVNLTGELAGVPPALLAHCPFKGATLTSLSVKQGTIRQQTTSGDIQEAFTVELSGPILPDSVHHLNQLFRHTQGDFTSSSSVQETTTPFNLQLADDFKTIPEYLESENVSDISHQCLPVAVNNRNNGRQAIRDFQCENNLYLWA